MNHTFLDEHAGLDSPIHRLDARLKLVLTFCFAVVAVSTPAQAYEAFTAYAVFVLVILLLSRVPLLYFFKRLAVILPFVGVVAIFIPFLPVGGVGGGYNLGWGGWTVSHSGLAVFLNVLAKSLLGASAVILLTSTTPFSGLLNGLAQLRAPRVVILIVSFAYRYLFVFVDEAQRMVRARDSRCYTGRWVWQAVTVGRMIGTLFLRSYERGERVYLAMRARGYEGESFERQAERLPLTHVACAGVVSLLLLSIRLCVAW
jgi:cobalt/nickel transport system permease protein